MSIRRKIVKIDEDKCNGCGLCVPSCAEGAIAIIDGKARLVSETYCDGLGACLGECPQDAISIEERQAEAFDEEAVEQHLSSQTKTTAGPASRAQAAAHSGCPGARMMNLAAPVGAAAAAPVAAPASSALTHWPVKLHLVPPPAPFLADADLMLVADCVPVASAEFHRSLLPGHAVVIGCPKFDENPQWSTDKLALILREGGVRSLTVVHMEVPCCFGYWRMGQAAWRDAGASIPLRQVIVSLRGVVKSSQTTEPVAG